MHKVVSGYVILWFIRYLVFKPHITFKIAYAESKKVVICYVNEVIFGKHLRMGDGCQWSQPMWLEGWNWKFQSHLSTFEEEIGTGGWVQLPMANDSVDHD